MIPRRTLLLAAAAIAPAAILPRTARAQAHAAVLDDADAATLAGVAAYLNTIRTLKARFLQIAPDGASTNGTCWLERPGRMRFEYDKPSPLLLVAGHGLVVVRDNQMDSTTNVPIGETPLGLLLADKIDLNGPVTTTAFEHLPGQLQITLVKTASPGEGSLTLNLEAPKLALTGWSVIDAQGRETRLRLTAIDTTPPPGGAFDPALFVYIDPNFAKPDDRR